MKNRPKTTIALLFVGGLFVLWLILAFLPRPQGYEGDNPFRRHEGGPPHIIAHAGGNMEFPDNTLEAYYNAYHVDPDVIMETDVAMTEDGVVVLTHDLTFDRKTDLVEAPVSETKYEDLMADEVNFAFENEIDENGFNTSGTFTPYETYDGRSATPQDVEYPEGVEPRHEEIFLATTLEELITTFPDNYMIVEMKQGGEIGREAVDAILELMEDLDDEYDTFERITLASFHRDIYDYYLEQRAEAHPELLFSPQEDAIREFYILHWPRLTLFFDEPVSSFQVPPSEGNINLATRAFINAANRHNIAVHYWTINDEETMRELVELGADGILTDRPTLLKEVIDDYYGETD